MKKSFLGLLRLAPLALIVPLLAPPVAQAAGEGQSPIDIRPENSVFSALPPLQFNFNSDTALNVVNTGSPDPEKSLRANVSSGAGKLMVSGHEWDLAQFHFHTPAEHLLNGVVAPMEMHLVFSDPSSSNLLVVGRWINESNSANTALDPIFSHLPQTTSDTLNIDHFNLNTLLPANLESFRYPGSLTTPPFSENVSWINLAQPLDLSKGQIDAFRALFPEGNAREVQDVHGRFVQTDVPGFATAVPEPETYAMLLAGLGLIILATRRQHSMRSIMPAALVSIA
ncbi:carbonic anhydrase [Nitrosospira sp. Nsp14]|uniref:carbonic anhydrase family protein n=1 Tax=Nitrosospira sp. Nsp14 TaxID=1855333 RepID=UPI0008E31B51|nr:carbonic anhydrase family protein [Nitrosospira sp. Nsp14]SFH15836.1 carbonic anhydrase [Nitrosospira sp. Nsp14]